jgi:hypothetical protein
MGLATTYGTGMVENGYKLATPIPMPISSTTLLFRTYGTPSPGWSLASPQTGTGSMDMLMIPLSYIDPTTAYIHNIWTITLCKP